PYETTPSGYANLCGLLIQQDYPIYNSESKEDSMVDSNG
ncbi:unnamed protein product, partial [Allacma fusca]